MSRYLASVQVATIAFAAGVILRDVAQDWADEAKKAELGRQAYSCSGYLVVDKDGNHRCAALMNRLDGVWPIPGDPTKLRKKELRRAIGGNYEKVNP